MKKYLKILPILMLVFFTINTTTIKAIDNFEIEGLKVEINVNKDGTYDITEDLTLNFFSPGLGIYRDLISVYKMDWDLDGKIVSKTYNFPISNINVEGDVFSLESQMNGTRIIVGPDSGERFLGEKKYQISYTVLSKPIDVGDQKEAFFYNLVSDWNADIHNFSATVNFYDEVEMDDLQVIGTTYFDNIDVACTNNSPSSFTCTYPETVYFGDGYGITALLPLEEEFFTRASGDFYNFFAITLSAILLAASVALWSMFGKDDPVIEVVSFKPPQGFNSAMVGYVFDDTVDNDDLYSLLFYWANQGLIQIKEEKGSKLEFTKLKNISSDAVRFEKELFNIMFYKDGPITTTDWQKQDLFSKMAISKPQVSQAVNKLGNLYDPKSKSLKYLLVVLAPLPTLYLIFSRSNFSVKSMLVSVVFTLISFFIFLFAFVIYNETLKKARIKKSASFFTTIFFMGLTSMAVIFVMFMANMLLGVEVSYAYLGIVAAASSTTLVVAHFMKKRSEYGSRIFGEILGLRAFIKYARHDELLAMQNENPHLYYDVLPYAYAFGMSDLWNTQFKSIEIPQSPYYTTYRTGSYTNYLMMNSLLRSVNRVPSQVVPKVQSRSGGASFGGGGGFSGGGFSGGGGFGGGGGGGR